MNDKYCGYSLLYICVYIIPAVVDNDNGEYCDL